MPKHKHNTKNKHGYYFPAVLISIAFSIVTFTTILSGGAGGITIPIAVASAVAAAVDEKVDDTTQQQQQQEEEDKNIAYDGSDLIEWINSNGGFIHPNARIGLDPTGQYRGVFVKNVDEEGGTEKGIGEDELVCSIPWDLIVKPDNYDVRNLEQDNCDAMHELYKQFQLGDESKYAPYINYLKNQPRGRLPAEWTTAGKELLTTILDQNGNAGLPPFDALNRYERQWLNKCEGEDTDLARAAFFQLTSRDEDSLMVPFYDMHNHSNDPKKLNTVSWKPESDGQPFTMYSTRAIAPGEQILISYNRCHGCWFDINYQDCETRSYGGTDFLFSQFGFTEDYPQFWNLPQYEKEDGSLFDNIRFCLDRNDDTGALFVRRFGDNYSDEEDEIPFDDNVDWFKEELERLLTLERTVKSDDEVKKTMPSYEWDMAWQYAAALVTAMSTAVETVEKMPYGDEKSRASSSDDDSEDNRRPSSSDDDSRDNRRPSSSDDDGEEDSEDDGEVNVRAQYRAQMKNDAKDEL